MADDRTSLSSCELHLEEAFVMGRAEGAHLEYEAVCGKVKAPAVSTTLALVMGDPDPITVAGDLGCAWLQVCIQKGCPQRACFCE